MPAANEVQVQPPSRRLSDTDFGQSALVEPRALLQLDPDNWFPAAIK